MATQSSFIRGRHVDHVLTTPNLNDDLEALLATVYNQTKSRNRCPIEKRQSLHENVEGANRFRNDTTPLITEAEYWQLLRDNVDGVLTALCGMYRQDSTCLVPRHAQQRTLELCGLLWAAASDEAPDEAPAELPSPPAPAHPPPPLRGGHLQNINHRSRAG